MRPTLSLIAAGLFLLFGCSKPAGEGPIVKGDVSILIEARTNGPWRVTYKLKSPQPELDLGYDVGGFRARRWTLESKGARLVGRDHRDLVVPIDGRRAVKEATFLVEPAAADLRKDYEPFMPMGDGGVLFYSGHFIPYADRTTRLSARFTIVAEDGATISAFDETAGRFDDWRSPFDHPAFIYVGSAAPVRSDTLSTITDATAPPWIAGEVSVFAPAIGVALREMFGRSLPVKPNIFVAIGDLSEPGKISYSGDALPGQYQMTLAGGAWKEQSAEALGVLRLATAHEAAHLWQAAARPKTDAVPDWIHEGGADALAAEAMVAAGYWSAAEADARFEKAKSDCARLLDRLSLTRAETDYRWDAVYACGHVINVAAAGEGSVAELWREFVRRAAPTGYDEAMFLALAEERAGGEAVAAMRDLIRINEARPETVIARMFGGAGDLAAGQGR